MGFDIFNYMITVLVNLVQLSKTMHNIYKV